MQLASSLRLLGINEYDNYRVRDTFLCEAKVLHNKGPSCEREKTGGALIRTILEGEVNTGGVDVKALAEREGSSQLA